MLSFPIPEEGSGIKYLDLKYKDIKYSDIMRNLFRSGKVNGKDIEGCECHLDPDIYKGIVARQDNWLGAFGQFGSAEGMLLNSEVQTGDLFLFFGWFKYVEYDKREDKYKYLPDKNSSSGFYAVFGYLEVGECYINSDDKRAREGLKYHYFSELPKEYHNHPHYKKKDKPNYKNNTIYVASKNLGNLLLPGYGVLKYSEKLKLTADSGTMKSECKLNELFSSLFKINGKLECHKPDEVFRLVKGYGQEYVIECSDRTMIDELIDKYRVEI
jgi:hypothetical protein